MDVGRFGHHPDPVTDFEVEVDSIEGLEVDVKAGLESMETLRDRVFKAMMFRVGAVERAVVAKNALRLVDARVRER